MKAVRVCGTPDPGLYLSITDLCPPHLKREGLEYRLIQSKFALDVYRMVRRQRHSPSQQ